MSIYAWTDEGANYPQYLNVADATDERGSPTISITIRGAQKENGPGDTVSITLPMDEYSILVGQLKSHFNEVLKLL